MVDFAARSKVIRQPAQKPPARLIRPLRARHDGSGVHQRGTYKRTRHAPGVTHRLTTNQYRGNEVRPRGDAQRDQINRGSPSAG